MGSYYRCPVGKPEFTPPELQGRLFAHLDRAPEHDLFGLAVLIFQLLMEGTHPFAGVFLGHGGRPPPCGTHCCPAISPIAESATGHIVPCRRHRPRPSCILPPINYLCVVSRWPSPWVCPSRCADLATRLAGSGKRPGFLRRQRAGVSTATICALVHGARARCSSRDVTRFPHGRQYNVNNTYNRLPHRKLR